MSPCCFAFCGHHQSPRIAIGGGGDLLASLAWRNVGGQAGISWRRQRTWTTKGSYCVIVGCMWRHTAIGFGYVTRLSLAVFSIDTVGFERRPWGWVAWSTAPRLSSRLLCSYHLAKSKNTAGRIYSDQKHCCVEFTINTILVPLFRHDGWSTLLIGQLCRRQRDYE